MAVIGFLLAALLPLAPQPAPPFARIETDAVTITRVAPGIEYGEYRLRTVDGPLSVHVLAIDPHEKTIRFGSALASETLVSNGEPLSSMAKRKNAVAGINADYFDIGQTNQPLNLLVEDGKYVRAPMLRPVFAVPGSGDPFIAEFTVKQTATFGGQTIALAPQNDWPPRGHAALLITPQYGSLHPANGVTLFGLQPADEAGTFNVLSQLDATQQNARGYYLALGPEADPSTFPPEGETLTIATQATPPLDDLVAAAGGGPLLVKDGQWYSDPHGPSRGEFATHMPATAAALRSDGTVLFFEVDGRQPALSIGVLQPQLAALAIAFGAQTAMQFDGGGSSTMVARLPGDALPEVVNSPSDGTERRIADALLIYSDAPAGPPERIATRPQVIRGLPGARGTLVAAEIDAGGHTIQSFRVPYTIHAGVSSLLVSRDGLETRVPVESAAPAYVDILPHDATLVRGETLALSVRAFDAKGYPMLLPAAIDWQTDRGSISSAGVLSDAPSDAHVSARVGDVVARSTVTVGEHAQLLPFASDAVFATIPAALGGSLERGPCAECATLAYDFSGSERAAYANVSIPLAQRALGLEADVQGDGNGETLRVAVENAIHERFLYTLARIDWHGWRHIHLRFPPELAQPLILRSVYVVAKVGTDAASPVAGAVSIKNVSAILAGSQGSSPK